MTGKYFYFALAALLAVLAAEVKFLPFFLLTLLYFFMLHRYKHFNSPQLWLVAGISIIYLFLGQAAALQHKTAIPESTTTFMIEYLQPPKIDGDLLQVEARELHYKEKLIIRYKIKSEAEKKALKQQNYFQYVSKVTGTMSKPKTAKNPNSFDYRKYLAARSIYWIVELQENPFQDCLKIKPSPLTILKQLRHDGIRYLEGHFPAEVAGLSAALIFGDRSMLDPGLLGAYQSTGIVHLLAISGLHVSLLVGMFFVLGIRCGFTREFMTNFLLLLLPIYVVLTGASPSVIRAALMIFLVLLTAKWKQYLKLLPIDAVSAALMLYLLFNPMVIFDVGFQLSFSVSAAIILTARQIINRYKENSKRILVTSITAQLAALPFLLYHFFEISLIGIFANMFYIPLFSFVYLPGLYLLFFMQFLFGITPKILLQLFLSVISFSNKVITFLADFTVFSFIPGRPSLFELLIYICIILAVFYLWEVRTYPKRKQRLLLLTISLFTFQPICNWLTPFGEITMIDVGQGDSIFIRLPFGKGNYLIDTGGTMNFSKEPWQMRAKTYEVGKDVVVPFLKGKGITRIDKLVLTHGDMDHIGGAFSLINELEVKEILLPAVAETAETERAIVEQAKNNGIPVLRVAAGDKWTVRGNEFYILGPERNFSGEINGGSITLYAKIGGLSWFFGGDLDQEGEEKIINHYPKLTVDVLKTGHHGSKTSSADAFIQQIEPKIALISVGENNRYGHPHQEVLTRFQQQDTKIFRTDRQGAITYRFYRGKGTFSTFLP